MSIIGKKWNHARIVYLSTNIPLECNYSSKVTTFSGLKANEIEDTKLTSLRRGTGGRSSFNGIVCTVFGASGFVGPAVVSRLGKLGTQLIIPYRADLGHVYPLRVCGDLGQLLFHHYNLRDEDSIRKAVVHSDVVINLVGREYETFNFSFDDIHVEGCQRIARICKEMGVKKFIHFSALNATEYPKSTLLKNGSGFLRSKWLGEQRVREEFPEAIIFRPADIWGESDRFIRYYGAQFRVLGKTMYMWNKGRGIIKQPVDVGDVVSGVVEAFKDPDAAGKVYQCVGPKRYYLDEFVNWLAYWLRRNDEWGYKFKDARFNPVFLAYLWMMDKSFIKNSEPTRVHLEKFELEYITDVVESGAYTLEDLGVQLTHLEDVIFRLTHWLQTTAHYEEDPHEVPDPAPPRAVP